MFTKFVVSVATASRTAPAAPSPTAASIATRIRRAGRTARQSRRAASSRRSSARDRRRQRSRCHAGDLMCRGSPRTSGSTRPDTRSRLIQAARPAHRRHWRGSKIVRSAHAGDGQHNCDNREERHGDPIGARHRRRSAPDDDRGQDAAVRRPTSVCDPVVPNHAAVPADATSSPTRQSRC